MSLQYHWYATQYLSLEARTGRPADPETYELARSLADRDARNAALHPGTRAWAYATLAELVLLAG